MVTLGEIAGGADCSTAINKAIVEWNGKEPTWAYPEAEKESGPGRGSFFGLDQRTRVAFGRPIAEALAGACGKAGVESLQKRVENAPELILLALDELGASDAVAESLVTLLGKEELNIAKDWPFLNKACFNQNVLVWASLCSAAPRRATALALVVMPPVTKPRLGTIFSTETVFSFVAVAGDKDTLHALETAANDPMRANWRPYYLEAASFIRMREALPPKDHDVRARDDLLFWQANADMLNSHAASMNYKQSAQTLANRHETISTVYLLEKLSETIEEISCVNYDREHHSHHSPRLNVGSVGLTLCILGKQRDPAAVPALNEFAKKNPNLAADVREATEAIQGTNKASRTDGTGTPGVACTHAQPDAGPIKSHHRKTE